MSWRISLIGKWGTPFRGAEWGEERPFGASERRLGMREREPNG